jgi:hypothetical protein
MNHSSTRTRRLASGSLALAVALSGSSAFADTIEIASPSPVSFGQFGISVSGIPDMNNDGYGDFIVGAWAETVGGTAEAGRVHIFSGRTGDLIRSHSSPNPEFDGAFGHDVVGIGDINSDGRGDYIVGAYAENGLAVTDSGRVYVYSGATGNLIRTHTMPGADSFGRFGYSVDAVPDLTGRTTSSARPAAARTARPSSSPAHLEPSCARSPPRPTPPAATSAGPSPACPMSTTTASVTTRSALRSRIPARVPRTRVGPSSTPARTARCCSS